MISIIIFNLMRNDHHTIFGINGSYAVLESKKYKIIEIFRTSECAGIDGIIITKHSSCGLTDTVLQVSQGAFTQLPIYIVNNLNQTASQLKNEDFWITAVENSIESKDWHEIDYSGKVLIIIGSEGRGIKKINLDNSDFQTTIPMQGSINSLNVSASVSAILFERLRQLLS